MSNRLGPGDLVVIAGGGISGLALAAALQSRPADRRPEVVVLERDPSFEARRQGYGVTLSETNAALAGLGILWDLRERNTRSSAHWTFRSDGRVLGYYGAAFLPEAMRKPSPWTNLRVPRNEVREVLASRLLPGTVRFGCRAVGYVEVEDGNGGGRVDVAVETVKARFGAENRVGGGAGRPEWTENADGNGDGVGTGAESGVSATEILRASLLVACDGVRSAVQRERLRGTDQNLNYLGVVLVTGFTTLSHPLLDGQGFYTLDGERARIFTMPFKSDDDARGRGAGWERFSRESDETGIDHPAGQSDETGMDHHPSAAGKDAANEAGSRRAGSRRPPLTMWQISVRVTEEEARSIASAPRAGPGGAKEFVQSVVAGWHDPVPAMFDAAVWEESWAGPLYDRDRPPPPPTGKDARSRVVAIGDAAHPMSPFKGMGANSALFDAWSLASWLEKAPIPRAIANFEREMIARAWAKVDASREAVDSFHGPAAVAGESPEFAGVSPGLAKTFLRTLGEKGVGAGCGGSLEGRVREVMAELGVPVDETASAKPYAYLRSEASGGRSETSSGSGSGSSETGSGSGSGSGSAAAARSSSSSEAADATAETAANDSLEALMNVVDVAVRAGLAAAGADPVRDGFESFAAKRLVRAKKYSARGRPAHDWVSRAALKIVHARRGAFDAGERVDGRGGDGGDAVGAPPGLTESSGAGAGAGDSPPGDSPPAAATVSAAARKAARRERLDAANRCVAAEIARVARKIRDELMKARDVIADARVDEDGQIAITTVARRRALQAKGLVACAGCGQFYAVHGGGMRQHWAMGGSSDACASAAESARSPYMTDEEALVAAGRANATGTRLETTHPDGVRAGSAETHLGTSAEDSSWRGSGKGRPGPWRGQRESGKEPRDAGLRAAAAGDVTSMEKLESEGAFDPIVAADAYGSGALHWAAGGGHLAACDWLVNAANVPIDGSRRKDGRTALHWAARNGHLDVVEWLVEKGGADPNRKTYDGDGAFSLAVWQGHLPVARYLGSLDAVDPGATNRWGCNALLWACIQHDPRGGGGGGSGTMRSGTMRSGDEEGTREGGSVGDESPPKSPMATVRWLVRELGVPVDVVNVNGHSALHKCAIYGHGDVIAWLLSETTCNRAEHMSPDDRGSPPSALAAANGYENLAAELRHVEDRTMRLPVVYDERVGDGA